MISAEISGARCEVPVPAGEPLPDAVVLNDGDLTYAEISFDPATLDVLAEAAMDVGDPVTEAVCWNAAWRMVTTGALAGADFAGLVARRLGGGAPLPAAGLEILLERAVTAADLYAPDTERAGLRASVAAASLAGVSAGRRGAEPGSCRALRPDAAAKAAAWELALAEGQDRRTTEAAARGIWVPGQEAVLAGFRERYFAEAVPALDGRVGGRGGGWGRCGGWPGRSTRPRWPNPPRWPRPRPRWSAAG